MTPHEDERGFTLIELLVVLMVIGILAAIAVPIFMNQRGKAYDAAVGSDLRNAASAQYAYLTAADAYSAQSPVAADLVGEGFRYSSGGHYEGGTAAIAVTVDGANGFCLTATSASGNVIVYDSENGGLQAANGSCSF